MICQIWILRPREKVSLHTFINSTCRLPFTWWSLAKVKGEKPKQGTRQEAWEAPLLVQAVPSWIHCSHLLKARTSSQEETNRADFHQKQYSGHQKPGEKTVDKGKYPKTDKAKNRKEEKKEFPSNPKTWYPPFKMYNQAFSFLSPRSLRPLWENAPILSLKCLKKALNGF